MTPLATNSLERALKMLEFIGQAPGGLTNVELSRTFGLARSTCSYILSRLEKEGYLVRDKANGKYRVGLKTLVLGRGALRAIGFRTAGEPILYRLATETGLAANLAVVEGRRVIIMDRIEGWAFVKAAIDESRSGREATIRGRDARSLYLNGEHKDASDELPVKTTALGKVFLAHMLEQDIAEFLSESTPEESKAAFSILAELAEVRKRGYCMMDFEPHNESCSLAAPILDATGRIRAAVSVSCRRHLAIWRDASALSEIVKEAAWEMSCRLYGSQVPHVRDVWRRPVNGYAHEPQLRHLRS